MLKSAEPNGRKRIEAKVALLKDLKARGVWLLDVSLAALYRPGGGKPTAKMLQAALAVAWDEYAAAIVRDVAPKVVMVIGKMVHDALRKRVVEAVGRGFEVQWMYQRQAHVSAATHAEGLERLRKMVIDHGRNPS